MSRGRVTGAPALVDARPTPRVHYCLASDRPLFLDLVTGRYFCLAEAAERAFLASLDGSGSVEFGRGDEGTRIQACSAPRACSSALEGKRSAGSMVGVVRLFACRLKAERDLRRRPLADVVDAFRSVKADAGRTVSADGGRAIAEGMAADRLCDRILTADGRCFPRSLALAWWLVRRGVPASLVLGVSLRPFTAHAWVQVERLVVNDTLEHVLQFTPILAA